MKPASSLSPAEQLAVFRARIDALDETLAQLLIERTSIIHEVAALKRANWPSSNHIRPGREGQMHFAIAKRFAGTDIPPAAALAIWRQLIGAATQLESPLTSVFLAHEIHHAWLAREYFGVGVGLIPETSLADALETIEQGKGNILLLPAAEQGDWWVDAALFRSHGLAVFASLPVTDAPLPQDASALALAKITPEPSGDDISYVVVTAARPVEAARLAAILPSHVVSANDTHHLLMVGGFLTEQSAELASIQRTLGDQLLSLTLLGAHPRAVSL